MKKTQCKTTDHKGCLRECLWESEHTGSVRRRRHSSGSTGSLHDWCEGLERAGLEQERRALRVRVEELCREWEDEGSLRLEFSLNAGAYATVVVRDLAEGIP